MMGFVLFSKMTNSVSWAFQKLETKLNRCVGLQEPHPLNRGWGIEKDQQRKMCVHLSTNDLHRQKIEGPYRNKNYTNCAYPTSFAVEGLYPSGADTNPCGADVNPCGAGV